MEILVKILHVIVCLFLMLTVLLQAGKGGGMGAAFGGGSSMGTVFGGSGAGNFLRRLTVGAAIIFMVTSTALVESEVASRAGMKVVLSKANAAGPVSQRRSDPVLTVTRNNELYLGSRKLEPANLEAEIRKALTEVGSETLLIRGDKNVYLGSAVDIMSVAKKAGATKIAILTAPNK